MVGWKELTVGFSGPTGKNVKVNQKYLPWKREGHVDPPEKHFSLMPKTSH